MAKTDRSSNAARRFATSARSRGPWKLIATARFKKALDRATEAEALHARKIGELAGRPQRQRHQCSHPLLKSHDQVKNTLLLVLCSNRGLCGGYNASILREAKRTHPPDQE